MAIIFVLNLKRNGEIRPVFAGNLNSFTGQFALVRQAAFRFHPNPLRQRGIVVENAATDIPH